MRSFNFIDYPQSMFFMPKTTNFFCQFIKHLFPGMSKRRMSKIMSNSNGSREYRITFNTFLLKILTNNLGDSCNVERMIESSTDMVILRIKKYLRLMS